MEMTDIANMAVSMMSARTQGLAEIKMLKAEHDMQMSLIQMLSDVALSAPAPGTGTEVDKLA